MSRRPLPSKSASASAPGAVPAPIGALTNVGVAHGCGAAPRMWKAALETDGIPALMTVALNVPGVSTLRSLNVAIPCALVTAVSVPRTTAGPAGFSASWIIRLLAGSPARLVARTCTAGRMRCCTNASDGCVANVMTVPDGGRTSGGWVTPCEARLELTASDVTVGKTSLTTC